MSNSSTDPPPPASPETAEFDEAWATELAAEIGTQITLPPSPVGAVPSAEDTETVLREAAARLEELVARRQELLLRLTEQPAFSDPDATREETDNYARLREEAASLLEPDAPDKKDLDTADAHLTAADAVRIDATARIAHLLYLREQVVSSRESLEKLPELDPTEAIESEKLAVDSAKQRASTALDIDPASTDSLRTARDAIKEARAAITEAQARIAKDLEERRAERAALQEKLVLIQPLEEAEATNEELKALKDTLSVAGKALEPEAPARGVLVTAREAIEKATKIYADATRRIVEDKAIRSRDKDRIAAALARKLDPTKADENEVAQEQTKRSLIEALIKDEHPPRQALDEADELLTALGIWLAGIEKSIDEDRTPRFDRALAAERKRSEIVLSGLEGADNATLEGLTQRSNKATVNLAPLLDWANVTAWNEEDIKTQEANVIALAEDVEKLRQSLVQARAQLSEAAEKVTSTLGSLSGGAFSSAQSQIFTEKRDAAILLAQANLLEMVAPLATLTGMIKEIKALDRVRTTLNARLKAVGDLPPAGLLKSETTEWTDLRAKAAAAIDQVLET